MALKYFRDGGHGHTQGSIVEPDDLLRSSEEEPDASARPLRIVVNSDGFNMPEKRAPFTMRIEWATDLWDTELRENRERYVVLLSGTQAGYGGEGPHGTAAILRALGVPEALVQTVFKSKTLALTWENNAWKAD